jgi:hypothetical protein
MRFDQLGVSYIERPAHEVDPSLGYKSAPVIEVDCGSGASWHWSGFRPDHIRRLSETLTPQG